MKKFFIGFLLLMTALSVFALQEVAVVPAARVASTVNSLDMYLRDSGLGAKDVGVIITAPQSSLAGANTITFKIQGKTASGSYYDLPGAALTSLPASTSTIPVLTVRPGINHSAGSTISMPIPPVFRVQATTTGTGTLTYQINVDRLQ